MERKTTRKLPKYLNWVEKQGIDKVKNGKESSKWSKWSN